jgi:hypothetical protein
VTRSRSGQVTLGVILLTVGAVLLVTRFVPLQAAPLWLLGLGLAFALLGVFQRRYPALVAGMVLLGVGAGMVLGDVEPAGVAKGAWSMLALGGAFVLLYAVDRLLRLRGQWWPLVPGVILLAIGAARSAVIFRLVPPAVEIAVRTWWPLLLVAFGLGLVIAALRR